MSSGRCNVSSGGPWEDTVAYSRAVRVGRHVWVAGTTAMTAGGVLGVGDAYTQTVHALRTVETALREAGASLVDVVRTRTYLVDLDHWPDVARAHREAFAAVRPAATMVEVRRLFHPDMLVEVEVEACLAE